MSEVFVKRSGARRLGMREHGERLIVAGAFVSYRRREPANGLQRVREDVGPCVEHDIDRRAVAAIIAAEYFDPRARNALVDCANRIGEDHAPPSARSSRSTAVSDEILPAKVAHGVGDSYGFHPVHLYARVTGLDVAETAAARAGIAEYHDRRRSGAPAFRDVRAAASLHTVLSASALTLRLTRSYSSPDGNETRSQAACAGLSN